MDLHPYPLTPEIADYLESVEWGFEAGVRYRILDRRAVFEDVLPRGELRVLREKLQIIGTIFSLRKHVRLGPGIDIPARYETLLSVAPRARGQGWSKKLLQATLDESPRGLQYAYVEEKNIPSAAAFKAHGYEPFGRFLAVTLNRFRPRLSAHAKLAAPEQSHSIKDRISDFYNDHALMDLQDSFSPAHYWIWEMNGQLLAGVQVEEERWSITAMPGLEGKFAVNVLPFIPLLNKILNPGNIPVLKISHLYCPSGHEKEFMKLIQHVLRYFDKKLALAYLDPKSPIYQRLKARIRFGFFNPLFETPVTIWSRFNGFSAHEISALKKRPFVISPLDIS